MRKSITSPIFGLVMVFLLQSAVIASDEIQQIRQSIAKKSANWTAGESWVNKLSPEERRKLCSASLEPPDPSLGKMISIPLIEDLPAQLDWRDNYGNWVTPVKNQFYPVTCGSCWDFSAVAQVESWWKIHNNKPDSIIDLSEQFILSCSGAGTCDGGQTARALEFIRTTGVPSEACFEYQADDQIPCSDACGNWQDEAIKIPGWGWITYGEDITNVIKSAVYRHPVSTSYKIYSDFWYYAGGVYEYVWGEFEGGHVILIVGWNDAEQSWICKNSFGPDWGENGYFRIKWGNCGIGEYIPFIWDQVTGGSAFEVSPNQIDIEMVVGDYLSQNVTVSNLGPNILEFSSRDYEFPIASHFHPDSFNNWDGLSLWCGDSQLTGYGNYWLQYLYLPALDLSGTTSPKLSCMGFWAVENPPDSSFFYDGFDGCNVWVSTNGGKTFNVAYPSSPQYNCQSMFSFAYFIAGHIAGWGGSSEGWIPVEFDLSGYKSDSVIIRFAFASDIDYCTSNDPLLYGFFVDDIVVSDGGNILFENYGDHDSTMKHSGNAGMEQADWLDISSGFGNVQPYDSALVNFTLRTWYMAPGRHDGILSFNSNDTTNLDFWTSGNVRLRINLHLPDYDVAVRKIGTSQKNIPVTIHNEMKAEIINCGLNDVVDFDAVCTVFDEEQNLYTDNVHISSISAGLTKVIVFEPLVILMAEKKLKCEVKVINAANDYCSFNNTIEYNLITTNLAGGFEEDIDLWTFEGGWGVTPKLSWTTGSSAHINSGITPYQNNMDAVMTLNPAVNLNLLDNAVIKYYSIFSTEQDKDICYVEISGDSLSWTKVDSFSGPYPSKWEQREVEFASLIEKGFAKGWLRFHFVSDSVNTYEGVFIDQVEIYPSITNIPEEGLTIKIPETWKLYQNYPNPFNPTTVISYHVPVVSQVELSIYNILGQKIATLVNKKQPAGIYSVKWDGTNVSGEVMATGLYFYRIQADAFSKMCKLILLR